MTRLLMVLLLVVVAVGGCDGARAVIQSAPGAADVQQVRALAIRVADATTAGLEIVNQAGILIDALPIDAKVKDTYDCAILQVVGTAQPASPTVTTVCGAVPLAPAAPLAIALQQLGSVTSCPSLRSTIVSILAAIDPLIARLAEAKESSLTFAAAALRTTFAIARTLLTGGGPCSI